jgi:hypothetical protein
MADPNSPEPNKRWTYKGTRDTEGELWTPYALPERIDYPNWSRDSRHIYAIARGADSFRSTWHRVAWKRSPKPTRSDSVMHGSVSPPMTRRWSSAT